MYNIQHETNTELCSSMHVCFSTEQSDKIEIDAFYTMVTNAMKLRTYNNLFVMGDYNARTGST